MKTVVNWDFSFAMIFFIALLFSSEESVGF